MLPQEAGWAQQDRTGTRVLMCSREHRRQGTRRAPFLLARGTGTYLPQGRPGSLARPCPGTDSVDLPGSKLTDVTAGGRRVRFQPWPALPWVPALASALGSVGALPRAAQKDGPGLPLLMESGEVVRCPTASPLPPGPLSRRRVPVGAVIQVLFLTLHVLPGTWARF